jgi:putative nucleotidyltransferase with HDIG domain
MIECGHNYDTQELNPYHLESDCWSHTMMVCKIAEISGYGKTVQIAALLHDIGKPAARRVNPRNNHIQFFGHEELSAQLAEDILFSMIEEGMIDDKERSEIIELIRQHSFLHRNLKIEKLLERFGEDKVFCIHLVQLSRCDTLGRFSADLPDDVKYQHILTLLDEK